MTRTNPPPGIFGHNRTMVTPHYAVMPPEGILESYLPGWRGARFRFHTSPQMGARFAQALIELAPGGGTERPVAGGLEHLLYVLSGEVEIGIGPISERLEAGGYAYVPAGQGFTLQAGEAQARVIWIKKPYWPADGLAVPKPIVSHRDRVARSLKHTDGRAWQHLLPEDDLAFDMHVNILSFKPGTHFPFVETHIMEHGLYMLQGQGLYLLGREWHECWAGDFVWMGSYVPQQFYCTGWGEAAYLLYKDVNRDVAFGAAARGEGG